MAGDWIKLEHATIDKPEIWKMADTLDIDPHHVLGSMISVWVWMDKQLESCNAKSVTKRLLDRKADITGFSDAMLQVGWLIQTDEGFEVPNFDRHLGNSAKKRSENARRVSKHRNKCNTKSVREEKRREEKKDTIFDFESFWNQYEKKGNRKTSLSRYSKIKESDRELIKIKLPLYIQSTPDKQFRKDAQSWLNQECWNDEVVLNNQPAFDLEMTR
jgi:hypothetical protein